MLCIKVTFKQRKPLRAFHYYLCTRHARRCEVSVKDTRGKSKWISRSESHCVSFITICVRAMRVDGRLA